MLPPPPANRLPPSSLPRSIAFPPLSSIDKVDHPLRCGHWAAVAADLSDPSWADALLAAGFDPSRPTVWVAEGESNGAEHAAAEGARWEMRASVCCLLERPPLARLTPAWLPSAAFLLLSVLLQAC